MFYFTRPSEFQIAAFLLRQTDLPFSYPEARCTQNLQAPVGYAADRYRVRLGDGAAVFHDARAAIERWAMFPRVMAEVYWPDAPIQAGSVVATLIRGCGLWTLNACRIVYVIDEPGPPARFGFAYGTLVGHMERGEERFLVEQLPDGSVWFEIKAYSRPAHPLLWLGYPIVRRQQRRFGRLALLAMADEVQRTHAARGQLAAAVPA